MKTIDFAALQQDVGQALRQLPGLQPPAPAQAEVWLSVRGDPNKLMSYVKERTGASGDALLKEMDAYTQAMKARYG